MSETPSTTFANTSEQRSVKVERGDIAPFRGTIGLYHGPVYLGEGGYESYRPYGLYVREFARHFEQVVVFAPVARGETIYRGYRLDMPNVRIVELPDFSTHLSAVRHFPRLLSTFRKEVASVDVINCRNTAPFGSLLYTMGRRRSVPFFYHFTSDPWEILTVGPRYSGVKGMAARAMYRAAFAVQKRIMCRTFSFVNGRAHLERLRRITPRMEPIISSTLARDDFVERRRTTLHAPVRLLYVGYLKHMKGLEYLIDALGLVRADGLDAGLTLVGDGPMAAILYERVRASRMEAFVHFPGFVSDAATLQRHYDEADLFVFPSMSEGSPRVVLEALARGLPVVSTPVGSVPDLLKDSESALFVPLRDARAIANAVLRLSRDEELRDRLSNNGLTIARQHTVETFVGRMAEKAKELVETRNVGR